MLFSTFQQLIKQYIEKKINEDKKKKKEQNNQNLIGKYNNIQKHFFLELYNYIKVKGMVKKL